MDPFRNLGRIPGLTDLLTLLQQQTEALAQLPRTLADLQGTVRQLTEATNTAKDTVASAQRYPGPSACSNQINAAIRPHCPSRLNEKNLAPSA